MKWTLLRKIATEQGRTNTDVWINYLVRVDKRKYHIAFSRALKRFANNSDINRLQAQIDNADEIKQAIIEDTTP